MYQYKLDLNTTFFKLKDIRPIINPNLNFIHQLMQYDYQLFGINSFDFAEYTTMFLYPLFEDLYDQSTLKRKILTIIQKNQNFHKTLEEIYQI